MKRVARDYALRCAIVNHRSRPTDFDLLVEAVVRIGREVALELQPANC
jgi:hypothetical protein